MVLRAYSGNESFALIALFPSLSVLLFSLSPFKRDYFIMEPRDRSIERRYYTRYYVIDLEL